MAPVSAVHWLLLSLLGFFDFPLMLYVILVATQCFQAQPSVTILHHGCVQFGCSTDALLIILPFIYLFYYFFFFTVILMLGNKLK